MTVFFLAALSARRGVNIRKHGLMQLQCNSNGAAAAAAAWHGLAAVALLLQFTPTLISKVAVMF